MISFLLLKKELISYMKVNQRESEKMDGIELIYKLQKVLRSNLQNVGDAMISGGVDNMEKYRYMLGQAQAYQYILQEISNLLETKEHDDTEQQQDLTNVVRFDEGGSKD